MEDPRRRLAYPDGNRPLGDFLFHTFMRYARDLDLPVQIHTGHMAGIRNDVVKTNAAFLTRLIELHQDTRFDLFHANWPYSGDLLFLGKNYPNVRVDFCWTNMVDPIYCQQMFRQAVSSMPHAKIHGYGTDLGGDALCSAWAHADLARDNIAIALADLVEMEYLDVDEAKEIAWAWLFSNANEFFRLQLTN
jgi:predicted TIM-barrel fold metal-dependent hydrolase